MEIGDKYNIINHIISLTNEINAKSLESLTDSELRALFELLFKVKINSSKSTNIIQQQSEKLERYLNLDFLKTPIQELEEHLDKEKYSVEERIFVFNYFLGTIYEKLIDSRKEVGYVSNKLFFDTTRGKFIQNMLIPFLIKVKELNIILEQDINSILNHYNTQLYKSINECKLSYMSITFYPEYMIGKNRFNGGYIPIISKYIRRLDLENKNFDQIKSCFTAAPLIGK